jgi:malonyl-CoA/methylmalonyl-CoA synthetase
VFLPLNTAYTPAELEYFVTDSGAGLLVCDPATAPKAGFAPEILTLDGDGAGSLMAAAAAPPPVAARGEDDLAAFLYTSGTTGRSKGAMLTHGNLLSNARTVTQAWHFTEADVLLHALPIYHTHGLFVATNTCLLAGCAMIFQARFETEAVVEALPRATAMMGVPTFYTRLLASPALDRDLVGNMRLFISGSAPLLPETHEAFERRTGHKVLERYGMTETNMNTSNPYDGPRRPGTVGPPLPGVELRVTEEGRELPHGEIGILEVRGPNVFKGYWNMPEKTAEDLRPDGWFVTGDLGVVEEDGYVRIVGRGKDLIISGGFNVYPREVEEALDAHPAILESAVIGVPHPDLGEAVVAVLVASGTGTPDLDAVAASLSDLAGFKRPKRYLVAPELPRNTMGKVQKAALREQHAALFR